MLKLLLITSIKSYEKQTVQLFKKAGINAFSTTTIKGFKSEDDENLIGNWFSSTSDQVNSILFFTFSEQKKIEHLLFSSKELNKNLESDNPIRAIVLNIEKHI